MPSPNGMTEVSGNTTGGTDGDAKQSEVKEKLPIKRSRGSLGSLNMITGKNNEPGKNSGASANGAYSKRHVTRLFLSGLCDVACMHGCYLGNIIMFGLGPLLDLCYFIR
jgi:hypothetical protein